MNIHPRPSRLNRLAAWAAILSLVWTAALAGCTYNEPLPQARKVADPSSIPEAVVTPRWELAAVRYAYAGQGINYRQAGLSPVYLVVKNTSNRTPSISPDEARAVAADGEYLPYTEDEALRVVLDSEQFTHTAANAAERGLVGAAVGAGLGALFGLIGGGDAVWKGAAIGGGVGGAIGAGTSLAEAKSKLKEAVQKDLYQYAWTKQPIPPHYTKVGYLYFPGHRNITAVKVTMRGNETLETHRLELHEVEGGKQ
jgi:hypothetical protein